MFSYNNAFCTFPKKKKKEYIALHQVLATTTVSITSLMLETLVPPKSWGGDPAIWRKVKEEERIGEHPSSEFTFIFPACAFCFLIF